MTNDPKGDEKFPSENKKPSFSWLRVLGCLGSFFGLLLIAVLFLVYTSTSESEKAQVPQTEEPLKQCEDITYERIDENTILITNGFTYRNDFVVPIDTVEFSVSSSGEEGLSFVAAFVPADDDGMPVYSAVNTVWKVLSFSSPLIIDNCIYVVSDQGGTITFQEDGVKVQGLEVLAP
jgi:hypothetical protein